MLGRLLLSGGRVDLHARFGRLVLSGVGEHTDRVPDRTILECHRSVGVGQMSVVLGYVEV
jgi:hypothetical protein